MEYQEGKEVKKTMMATRWSGVGVWVSVPMYNGMMAFGRPVKKREQLDESMDLVLGKTHAR